MFFRRHQRTSTPPATVFGKQVVLRGELVCRSALCIRGSFFGNIETSEALIVDRGATVSVDRLSAGSLSVKGILRGNIISGGLVELLPGSRFTGSLRAPRVSIAEGAVFEGSCAMRAEFEMPGCQTPDDGTTPVPE